jgi:epsin
MGSLHLGQFKKQASFFIREKLKTARLVLTDVTEAELMTEEATNNDPWGPETRRMAEISRAAFEVDDYSRIVNILHKRLSVLDTKSWRETFKTLVLLEYLLTHGPESFAADFRSEKDVLHQLTHFQHVDDLGFDWGQSIQRKAERILELLNQEKLLKEERNRARRVSRGITGSGSVSSRPTCLPAFESSESTFNDIPKELGASYEEGVDQTTEMKTKNYENGIKIYSRGFSSPGISTNITTQDEELSFGEAHTHTISPRSDNVGSSETKNDNNAYHSNTEWQPFQGRKLVTSTGHSFRKPDVVNLMSDQDKHRIPVQANSTPPKTNTSDGFHAYGYRLQSERLVNCSKGKQDSSPTACSGSEIDPFDDIDNDTATQCLLSNNQKRCPTSILDFNDSAGLAIKI